MTSTNGNQCSELYGGPESVSELPLSVTIWYGYQEGTPCQRSAYSSSYGRLLITLGSV